MTDETYPLGPPLRRSDERPEWVPIAPGSKIEVNRRTGLWRNAAPTPPAQGAPYVVPPIGGKP